MSRFIPVEPVVSRGFTPSLYEPSGHFAPYLNAVHRDLLGMVADIRGKLEAGDHYKLYEAGYFARGPVLEVGRLAGKSTVLLAMGIRDGDSGTQMYSIEFDEKLVVTAQKNLAGRGLEGLVTLIQGDSSIEISKLDDRFDVVFVDGDHSYEGVRRDLLALCGRLRPSALVMFHDYFHPGNADPDNPAYGVRRAVDEGTDYLGIEFRGRCGGIALYEHENRRAAG